ncbi:leucine-rich repeat-containing protein 23 isoform X1 [Brienomyrus brachyistius]|uniref:leucine-rich repeat-containing protein 23 isoform X1 n=2 Tax=Brienomyrus brachyistius TaxID=42636 RepID=UPI0020B3D228|nr:leucine-rich repeat-containing protein 23 isoform X1 [Brienomyrus brachyistius]XP_048880023.1 leucine-rich repeat-containing protein 23 isoform X1 [Brienomyrus brachyistius]
MSDIEEEELSFGESEEVEEEEDTKEEDEEEHEGEDAVFEPEDQIVACPVSQEMIVHCLSMLCKIGNGLAHAFVKMDLRDRRLTDIALLSNFVHLRFLDISSNCLSDLSPLAALTQLLWLKVDGNWVESLADQPMNQLAYLQCLSMATNRIHSPEGLKGPALESLNLIGNSIQRMSGLQCDKLANLVTLELRGNQLETTDGIQLPNLRRLYLAQNRIKQLKGLDHLERLTTLHLRDNQLEILDGISANMKALQYLNIRGNLVSSQKALHSLTSVSGTLQTLVLSENPLAEAEDYRLHLLARLPLLERLDKKPVTADEREEGQAVFREFEEDDVLEQD